MKTPLHIIGNNKLYGLADSNEIEIVECVYDNIKHLKSGKYIVIKDKMAGILDERGKILRPFELRRSLRIMGKETLVRGVKTLQDFLYRLRVKETTLKTLCKVRFYRTYAYIFVI